MHRIRRGSKCPLLLFFLTPRPRDTLSRLLSNQQNCKVSVLFFFAEFSQGMILPAKDGATDTPAPSADSSCSKVTSQPWTHLGGFPSSDPPKWICFCYTNLFLGLELTKPPLNVLMCPFIHSWYFSSASSRPLLLRGAHDCCSIDTLSELALRSATRSYGWSACMRSLRGG